MTELASASQLRMSYARAALVVVPVILLLGIASGSFSGSGMANDWFETLDKPALMPPGWAFPVAWTFLYALIGFALAGIVVARRAAGRGLAIGLFVVQLALNLAWSPIFFALHRMDLALLDIALMILFTIATILAFARVRRRSSYMMLPYLAWLCFAAWLNFDVERLNPDGGRVAPAAGSAQIAL